MINAKVDSVVYEGIEKITTGGKTVELSEVYSGSQSITANGTYDIGGKAEVVVNVPTESTGGTKPTGSINISTNGTHDVTDYAQAVVNVPQTGYGVDDFAKGGGGNESLALFYKTENVETTVSVIRKYAFAGLRMYKVTAPNATELGDYSFQNAEYVKEVVAPNVTKLGKSAFMDCWALTKADYPLCTTAYAPSNFQGCRSLVDVNFPALTSIPQSFLQGCAALISVSLPAVTSLGNSCFSGCTSLTNVELPNMAGLVPQSAFNGCTSLEEITLPLTTGLSVAMCFAGCTALKKVDLGVNATTLKGTNVFQNCTALETVILRHNGVVTANNGVFSPSANGVTVYVPSAQIAAYQADSMWSTQSKVTFAAIEGSDYE